MITLLLRLFLFLVVLAVLRGIYRAWRVDAARGRERRRAAENGKYGNLSDQDVSDADFEEIPKDE